MTERLDNFEKYPEFKEKVQEYINQLMTEGKLENLPNEKTNEATLLENSLDIELTFPTWFNVHDFDPSKIDITEIGLKFYDIANEVLGYGRYYSVKPELVPKNDKCPSDTLHLYFSTIPYADEIEA